MIGEVKQERRVIRLNRENCKAVSVQAHIDEVIVGLMDRDLSDVDFDRKLPIACWANEDLIRGIVDQGRRSGADPRVPKRVPQERVRVEENPHGMYSAKSFRWSSSSALIVIMPRHRPGPGRLGCGGRSATMRATG